MATRWTDADVPDQQGRTAVITGGNNGIGLATATILARHGATVVLACRSPERAADAVARIHRVAPAADVHTEQLDLASMASVRRAAERLRANHPRIELLINNAGALTPTYHVTEDGFERTLATNHLGHFALTGLLLEHLLAVPGSRVVTVSSIGHRRGTINFDDLHFRHGYRYQPAYFQSKLANLMFTYELDRRLTAAGASTIALAAHPGNARTGFGSDLWFVRLATRPQLAPLTWWLLQSAKVGALASVRAAVDPTARGGQYYGPPGRAQFTGYPTLVDSIPLSHDRSAQQRLWHESERMTGVTYPLKPATRAGT